jgi:hypothetical protein
MKSIVIEGKIWKYQGPAAWYFLSTTKEQGAMLRAGEKKRIGWGSKRIEARLGGSAWKTSLFPTKEGPYVLPVKASVRKKEGVGEGSPLRVECTFL